MSRKHKGGGGSSHDEAARAAREEAAAVAKLKAAGEAPLRRGLGEGLASLKEAMEAEAAEKARLEKARREKALARGERLAPEKKPYVPAPSSSAQGAARKSGDEVWRPDLDKELFAVAMSGVVPLSEKRDAGGRPVPRTGGSGGAARVGGHAGGGAARDAGGKHRRAQAEGDETIAVAWDEDKHCRAARRGKTFALEALGRFAVPQDTLDLHRADPAAARARVEEFVRTRRARGLRVVCVVHGIGKHAPDGESVLRDVVVRALSEPPGSREVDAFQTADKGNGGAGAVLVALRGPTNPAGPQRR